MTVILIVGDWSLAIRERPENTAVHRENDGANLGPDRLAIGCIFCPANYTVYFNGLL